MSSSGISATNSGPLAIRTYTSGSNKTFVLTDYDIPVPSNYILIISSNGELVPSNSPTISSIQVSTISTNLITMTNGYIDSQNGLTVKGVLNISSTTGDDGDASISLFNNKASITTNTTYDGIYLEASDNKPIYLCNTDNIITYARFSPSSMVLDNNTTVQMANGSIIGISSISSISGTLDITGRIRLVSSSAGAPGIYFTEEIDNDTGIYGVGDGKIAFSANGQQRMLITSTDVTISPNTGNVCYITNTNNNGETQFIVRNQGTTSTIASLSLETNNGISQEGYKIYASQYSGISAGGLIPSTLQFYAYPSGNNVLTIYPDGNATLLGNLTQGSDIRLKDRISTIQNSLATVLQMRGVTYYPINSSVRKIGVIAQEVEKVLPEVVLTDNSSEGFKSVSYGHITGLLIEAIKELSDKVDKLAGI